MVLYDSTSSVPDNRFNIVENQLLYPEPRIKPNRMHWVEENILPNLFKGVITGTNYGYSEFNYEKNVYSLVFYI